MTLSESKVQIEHRRLEASDGIRLANLPFERSRSSASSRRAIGTVRAERETGVAAGLLLEDAPEGVVVGTSFTKGPDEDS